MNAMREEVQPPLLIHMTTAIASSILYVEILEYKYYEIFMDLTYNQDYQRTGGGQLIIYEKMP